jgi:SAM-dependent methyltransferase
MADGRTQQQLRRYGTRALNVTGDAIVKASRRVREAVGGPNLVGDRWIEWSFCINRLGGSPASTLDFGAENGFLSLAAADRGHDVVALDREPADRPFQHARIESLQADILDRPTGDRTFDNVVNCSSVEHVGLSGRYESFEANDGDLEAMSIMADALKPGGRMIMTLPVGLDGVFAPYHRVYGEERLPRLLERFEIAEELYWVKAGGTTWRPAERAGALATQGSESFYSLGLFVLRRA